jgi:DNA polymerase III epsilon subunit-like protein
MAVRGGVQADLRATHKPVRRLPGNLPMELTSFVGRGAELAKVKNPSSVVEVICGSSGLRDESGRSLHDALLEFACLRKLLLVLDNCEQVVDEAAKLAEELLRGIDRRRCRSRIGLL